MTMIVVLLSWMAMDLSFLLSGLDESILEVGGFMYPVRIFHRYVGGLFVIGFILYGAQLATNEKLRGGLTRFD
ncbi:hypothetical protein KEJ39_07875, partial [Candidatus Bathyarchaeota archaeon]|nr:hypothetical protein [Candidatus Bathyarchaeota archaeon]